MPDLQLPTHPIVERFVDQVSRQAVEEYAEECIKNNWIDPSQKDNLMVGLSHAAASYLAGQWLDDSDSSLDWTLSLIAGKRLDSNKIKALGDEYHRFRYDLALLPESPIDLETPNNSGRKRQNRYKYFYKIMAKLWEYFGHKPTIFHTDKSKFQKFTEGWLIRIDPKMNNRLPDHKTIEKYR